MSDGMGREFTYLSSHATNRYFIPNWGIYLTHIPLPSSILGMLLLTLLLKLKVIRLEWVRSISDFLVGNIGFFFVPPGVAIMLYFDIIKAQLLPIVVSTVASTILVLAVTGWVHQFYGKAKDKLKG